MNYAEVIQFLYTQLPVFHREGKKAYKPGLENTLELCQRLGNPQNSFKSLHIAGTNGKGSSSHFIASILQEHGYKVGLYTSPHLKSFTERIKLNGVEISESWICEFVNEHLNHIDVIKPSFFEWSVGMAFIYFAEQKVDWAIIETGLGGRLDSTNIIKPSACLITNIGYDHQDILGETLPEIAAEKAGIIKNKVPITISEKQVGLDSIFINKAKLEEAPIHFAEDEIALQSYRQEDSLIGVFETKLWGTMEVQSPYVGMYQLKNIRGVISWCQQMHQAGIITFQKEKIQQGIKNAKINTGLSGRYEILSQKPFIVIDTAHNESGIRGLLEQVMHRNKGKLVIILGMVADKDLDLVLQLFPKQAKYIFSEANNPRAISAENLQQRAFEFELEGIIVKNVNEALKKAKSISLKEDTILITGSTYLVAEVNME